MWIYLAVSLSVAVSYLILLHHFTTQWQKIPEFSLKESHQTSPLISVLVSARNEEASIKSCIKSILSQTHHNLELLVLDNHSSDNTADIVQSFDDQRLRLYQLDQYLPEETTFKKEALSWGVAKAAGTYFAFTDADCLVPKNWLRLLHQSMESKGLDLVVGPVSISDTEKFIQLYESLDVAGLSVVTASGLQTSLLLSGNGANMMVRAERYLAAQKSMQGQGRASGDDIFLVQEIAVREVSKVGFCKSPGAQVWTSGTPSWGALIQQRKRWASKNGDLPHVRTKMISLLIFMTSILLAIHLLLIPLWGMPMIWLFLVHLCIKSVADYRLLSQAIKFFQIKMKTHQWLLSFLINPWMIAIPGILSLSPTYRWKDRTTR